MPSVWVPGSSHTVKAPGHLPATGAAATAWSSFLSRRRRPLRARTAPSGRRIPRSRKRPIRNWQIWNEQNFKYFVAKPNPAEYGKLVKISYAALKGADPGAKLILGGLFARPKGGKSTKEKPQARLLRLRLPRTDVRRRRRGSSRSSTASPCTPTRPTTSSCPAEIEEVRDVLEANQRRRQGALDHRARLELRNRRRRTPANVFAKGANGQAAQLKGAFTLLVRNQVKWKLQRVFWFSVDDQTGTCNFCDGSGLFAEGFVPKKSWYEYVKFAGGTP